MNPIAIALKGKGPANFLRRGTHIARRYGLTPAQMQESLSQLITLLHQFGASATFPITAVALQRNPASIRQYQKQGIEFAIHGCYHRDHSQLSLSEQQRQLVMARQIFDQAGVQPKGFRSPYLRWNSDTLTALQEQGFVYDSSQGLTWDVLDDAATPAYNHVVKFYGAVPAERYLAVPSIFGSLVRIPYTLPDDEALVERLNLTTTAMCEVWQHVLRRAFEWGELFTLGLHPERTVLCREPLRAVLTQARSLKPSVWIARLDEIADWWRARSETKIKLTEIAPNRVRVQITGPDKLTVLARNVQVQAQTVSWIDDYRQVLATEFTAMAAPRPFIGVSPATSPRFVSWLQQQGYIVEVSEPDRMYAYYFDRPDFRDEQARPVLAQIENTRRPLVRLSRWPERARSALCVTGDIDALTLWDYGLRLFGK